MLALASLATGCSMSMQSYDRMSEQVQARNDARYQAAVNELRERGYEFAPDVAGSAFLAGSSRERCVAALDGSAALQADESLRLMLRMPAEAAVELSADRPAVCEFFAGRLATLDARRGDEGVHLVRSDAAVARARDHSLVSVDVTIETTSTRSVLVETTCNRMPSPGPEPVERSAFSSQRVLVVAEPSEHVAMHVEREELEMECTDYVY